MLDMASAYSTFAGRGRHIDPYVIQRVETAEGEVLYDVSAEQRAAQVIRPETADLVTSVLTGVLREGTGTAASIGVPAAGKTGTTSDNKDAWFAGYTCHLTAAVWMGYEQPKPMDSFKGLEVSGGTVPARIWRDFMVGATANDEVCDFPEVEPEGELVNQRLEWARSTTTEAPSPSETTTTEVEAVEETTTTTSAPTTTAPTTTAPPTTTTAPTTTQPPPTTTEPPE